MRGRLSRRRRAAAPAPGGDRLSGIVRAVVGVLVELLKLGREMLVIPAQLWIYAAERAGAVVLTGWRRLAAPLLRAGAAALIGLYDLAARHVTPARATAAAGVAALVALVASQWMDLSSVTVGNDAYAPGVQTVAPAPEVSAERAGDAHAWLMVPIALGCLALLVGALRGRFALARLLTLAGLVVIAIAIAVDAPQGLDEGTAELAYQGADAQLLEGFWVQIASGATLVAVGLLLPAQLRGERASAGRSARRRTGIAGRELRLPGRPRKLGGQTKLTGGTLGGAAKGSRG